MGWGETGGGKEWDGERLGQCGRLYGSAAL